MVRFLADVKWNVVGLGIRHVRTVGKIESDVKEVDGFFVCFNCNFEAIVAEDAAQIFLDKLYLARWCILLLLLLPGRLISFNSEDSSERINKNYKLN